MQCNCLLGSYRGGISPHILGVTADCNGIDVNAEMVRVGMAWVYDKYVTDRSPYALQDAAKAARRGLWADPDPMPPWEWRHRPE